MDLTAKIMIISLQKRVKLLSLICSPKMIARHVTYFRGVDDADP